MIDWYNGLTPFLQTVFIIACVATAVMLIQVIFLLIGFGVDSDIDVDIPDDGILDGDPINNEGFLDIFGLRVLTVRNIFIFLAMAGWGILVLYDMTEILWLSIVLGIIFGAVMVFLAALAMKKAMSLQNEGNVDINNSVGKVGSVYLTIPAQKSGFGKVNVLVQERLEEFEAVTEDLNPIPTGSDVEVVAIESNYLVVKKRKIE